MGTIKEAQGTATSLTITLASLASSTDGLTGRQTTLVDNTSDKFPAVRVYYSIELGTSPSGDTNIYFRALHSDDNGASQIVTDGAGASDAALTALGAPLVHVAPVGSSPNTGDVIEGSFLMEALGPEWGIHVGHDTGVNLDSTGSNHSMTYIGLYGETA